jgi:hypothetical protein
MIRYIVISLVGGFLFGIMDGVINANPLAQKLYEVYRPIARTSINPVAGVLIDIAYGFILAAIFLIIYEGLPGQSGILKGLSYAFLIWFFRVVMYAASTWMMYKVPAQTIVYGLIAGLLEMLVLGILFGVTLKPSSL